MRIDLPGVARVDGFRIAFEGREIEAWPGESIAAALVSAGESAMRETRQGEPRGLWCGMGVCGECRVTVDGVVQRACMTMAAPGQRITRAAAKASAGDTAASPANDTPVAEAIDVLVIGAGPAGLSAARIAAAAGLSVVVADERVKAGGQYFKQPGSGFAIDPAALDAQAREGRALIAAAEDAGVRFLFGRTLWGAGIDDDGTPVAHLADDDRSVVLRPRRLVLAMGAYERPWPVPGWTLPGVMTTGAAQTLLRAYATAPGRRVLVAGNGPLNVQVACELGRSGAEVVALCEAARAPGIAQAGPVLRMAAAAPGLVLDGARMTMALARRRIPTLHGHVVTRLSGEGRVEEAQVAPIGADGRPDLTRARSFSVDAVCLGYGFLPQMEAARALGCATMQDTNGATVVRRGDDGATSVASVRVIGDGGGLGGARIAIAQGELAGTAICAELGRVAQPGVADRARTALARHRRFQDALWTLYAPVGRMAAPADAVLCRCESVTAGQIDALIAGGAGDLSAVKRASRAGMGACGGRYCAALVEERLGGAAALPGFAPRAPFKPVTIGAIAAQARP